MQILEIPVEKHGEISDSVVYVGISRPLFRKEFRGRPPITSSYRRHVLPLELNKTPRYPTTCYVDARADTNKAR